MKGMAEGQGISGSPPSVWGALQSWAATLPPWARYILTVAVNHGRLTDQQIANAYTLFLVANQLAPQDLASGVSIPSFATRPSDSTGERVLLEKVDGLRGVNAIAPGASLTFGPKLTIVFGRNGAGKSGFARLFGNACFSRQPVSILPDIYAEGQRTSTDATFHVSVGGKTAVPLRFGDDSDPGSLKRLSVFDAGVARHHITQSSAFEFKPAGFDVFPEMTRVYAALVKRLEGDIAERNRPNTFPQAFLGGGSPTVVHDAVSQLGAQTDLDEIRRLAAYGPTESARLTELDAQLVALKANSPKELLAQLSQAVQDIDNLRSQLSALGAVFSSAEVSRRKRLVDDAREKAATASALGSDHFRRPFFRAVGTSQWEAFASAAHGLARQEDPQYPRTTDRCLLCERPFDDDARSHVEALLRFVESDARRTAAAATELLAREQARLKELDLSVFAPSTRVHGHVARLSPTAEREVTSAFEALAQARVFGVADLSTLSATEQAVDVQAAVDTLNSVIGTAKADIVRLQATDVEASIASLDQERRILRHRQVLSQQLAQIEKYVEDAKWARGADSARASLGTRAITDKEKELFGRIIGDSYRTRLISECEELDCNVPIELQTVGRSGQTLRSLAMPGGHKPDAILSEGEQRAVALADFLTEVGQNPDAAGIILDDPVNSLDHERRERIARRLVREAHERQVIVFTHDLVFLNQLATAAEDANVEMVGHWIERDNEGRPGKIALGDSPATAKVHETTLRAEEALARARQLTGSARETEIRTGMGALRRTLEETVVRKLLKGVVPRWSDRVIVTALPRINWDAAKVEEICGLYEDLSRYIEGHSHTDEASGAPPQPADLESRITKVRDLIKWAKADRST